MKIVEKNFYFWKKSLVKVKQPEKVHAPRDSQGWVESHDTLLFGFWTGSLGHIWKIVKNEVSKIEKIKIFEI